jgi:hypothetical protein
MQHEGQWLIGKTPSQRVSTLMVKLNEQTIANIEGAPGHRHQSYAPWMSTPKARAHTMSRQSVDTALSRTELANLHAFLKGDSSNLAAIGMCSSEFHVLHDDSRAIEAFYQETDAALAFIKDVSPNLAALWDEVVSELIPLEPNSLNSKVRYLGSGISNHQYRGGIFTHLPIPEEFRTEELAINLVHELGHQVLMAYQYADPIFECDPATEVYSAIRKVNRPLVMSFHAVVALAFMCEFTRLAKERAEGKRRSYLEKRHQEITFDLQIGLKALEHIDFTKFGRRLVQELSALHAKARSA